MESGKAAEAKAAEAGKGKVPAAGGFMVRVAALKGKAAEGKGKGKVPAEQVPLCPIHGRLVEPGDRYLPERMMCIGCLSVRMAVLEDAVEDERQNTLWIIGQM